MAGCGAQNPTAPDHPVPAVLANDSAGTGSSPAQVTTLGAAPGVAKATSTTLDLLQGTLSVSLPDGSAIWGTYRGSASTPSGSLSSRAKFEGDITGGTGTFAGATGTFRATGTGGFVNDGPFSATIRASVSTANRSSIQWAVTLTGVSTSTCSTTAPPRMMLDGTGNTKGPGTVMGHLEHNLGSSICAVPVG